MVKQKGNVLLLLCAFIALIFVASVSFYAGQKYFQMKNQITDFVISETGKTSGKDNTIKPNNETTNWKTYASPIGFTLQYPPNFVVVESGGGYVRIYKTTPQPNFPNPETYLSFQVATKTDPEVESEQSFSGSRISPTGTIVFVYASLRDTELNDRPLVKQTFQKILSTMKFVEFTSNILDLQKAKPGDKVGGMTIVSIKPLSSSGGPITEKNVTITFAGKVTINGEYYQLGPNEMIGTRLGACFGSLDDVSAKLMPQLASETSRPGFCFSNKEFADQDFSTGEGKATITIDHYVLNRLPAEVWDMADLIAVTRKN